MCVCAAVCEPTELVLFGCRHLAKSVCNGFELLDREVWVAVFITAELEEGGRAENRLHEVLVHTGVIPDGGTRIEKGGLPLAVPCP